MHHTQASHRVQSAQRLAKEVAVDGRGSRSSAPLVGPARGWTDDYAVAASVTKINSAPDAHASAPTARATASS